MEYEKKLSIIVPVYNVEQFLERCILSLLNQNIEKSDYEIIIVNDGSTDNSYEIAQKLKHKNDNITLLTQDNKGLSGARNTGLDNAKGEFVMFVDSDDRLFPNVLLTILQTAKNNNLDVCAFRVLYYDKEGNEHLGAVQPFEPDRIYDGKYAVTHGADIGAVWLNMYSRAMIEKHHLRFLDKIYHQDVDFNLQMYAYANKMMFLEVVAYCYCYNESAISRITNSAKAIKHIMDDFIIVRHISDFSMQDEYGKQLQNFYRRHCNSMVVSRLWGLIKNSMLNRDEKLLLFAKLIELKLYPIKGNTKSWKTNLLKIILNCKMLYMFLLK